MDPKLQVFVGINVTMGILSGLGAIFQPKEIMHSQLKQTGRTRSDSTADADFAFISGLMGCAQIGRMMCGIFAFLSGDNSQLQNYTRGVFAADIITLTYYFANRQKLDSKKLESTFVAVGVFAIASGYFGFVRKYE